MTLNDYIAQEAAIAQNIVNGEDISTEATAENTAKESTQKSTRKCTDLFNTKLLAKAFGKRRYEHFDDTDEDTVLGALEETIWAAYHTSASTTYHQYSKGRFVVTVVYLKDPNNERVLEKNDLVIVRPRNRALVRKFLNKADRHGGLEMAHDCAIGWYRIRFAICPETGFFHPGYGV